MIVRSGDIKMLEDFLGLEIKTSVTRGELHLASSDWMREAINNLFNKGYTSRAIIIDEDEILFRVNRPEPSGAVLFEETFIAKSTEAKEREIVFGMYPILINLIKIIRKEEGIREELTLFDALADPLWITHKPGDQYSMKSRDGSVVTCTIAYFPMFGTWDNIKDKKRFTLEEVWKDFDEPRALIEIPMEDDFDFREMPLRYLERIEK